jgi:hypothetical protein
MTPKESPEAQKAKYTIEKMSYGYSPIYKQDANPISGGMHEQMKVSVRKCGVA